MTATNNTISDDTEDLFENLNELAASVESHTDALTIIRKHSDIARAKREMKTRSKSSKDFSRPRVSRTVPSVSMRSASTVFGLCR